MTYHIIALKKQLLLLFAVLISLLTMNAQETKAVPLWNGKDLTEWVRRGGTNDYRVENGVIIGKVVNGSPSSYLCTVKEYSNFILEYDFKTHPKLNAGVQFRSAVELKGGAVETKSVGNIVSASGSVHGYQAEIDMDSERNRMWTLGLYDQNGRKWLYPGVLGGKEEEFSTQGRLLSKQNDWNHAKIKCEGDHIQIWFNGELRVDTRDSVASKGFFALQVHHTDLSKVNPSEIEKLEVDYKNLLIQELP